MHAIIEAIDADGRIKMVVCVPEHSEQRIEELTRDGYIIKDLRHE